MRIEAKTFMGPRWNTGVFLFVLAMVAAVGARADDLAIPAPSSITEAPAPAAVAAWRPLLLAAQYNGISQHLRPFDARYSLPPQSLPTGGQSATSQTFGVYFGMAMSSRWQAYLDIERFVGDGIGNAQGLGSPTDGDVVRAGTNLPKTAYIARAYLQYMLPLEDGVTSVDRAQDQLPGTVPTSAFLFKAGKLSVGDDFDQNRYANNTRTQFETWTLVNNGAFDYAADTRGYTGGLVFGYLQPGWSLKFGRYRMPLFANQETLEWPLALAHGDNLELDLMPNDAGTVLRFLIYKNVARMGVYQQAIDKATPSHSVPDIAADDAEGREKRGFGINLEQPLADNGDTGIFLRLGWNDGRTETFAFTEADRELSFGGQISGARWGRAEDRFGLATSIIGLSSDHQRYLELGGCGFELCDGALNYGREQVIEAFYRIQIGRYAQLSPDYQFFENPGYNRDRGPARVYGIRLHLQY